MNYVPVCTVCRTVFKHTGPVPYLLPCLHAVCETCVTTSVNGDISCSTCGIHVDTRKRNLCPDVITQHRILDLTIEKRPSEILCTHEDDGNQAVCWCQECEEFLCEHCQNVHQSFKVTRRHSIQEITSALCNTVSKVEYCSVHKIYPLDTWDKTCKILICVRCRRDSHAEHDVEDVEVAEEDLKSEMETRLLQMKSVESNFEKMSRKMEQQIRHAEDAGAVQKEYLKQTFQSLRQLLDQREKEVLVKLDHLTSRIIKEAKLQKQATEVKQRESMQKTEYITSVLSYPNKRALFPLKAIITERTESDGIYVVDRKSTIPHFNSHNLEHLKSLISNFSDVELQKKDEELSSTIQPATEVRKQYSREFLLNLRYTELSIKRPRILPKSFPEIVPVKPFTKPPDTVSGTSDDSDIPIWSDTLNAKAKASGNVKRQGGKVQPATKSSSDVDHADLSEEKKKTKVVTAEELNKDVNDLVLLLKQSASEERDSSLTMKGTQHCLEKSVIGSASVPIAQPSRPPSGSGMVSGPTGGTLPKRGRKPIPITDSNSGHQVHTETVTKTTLPSGSIPVGLIII